MEKEIKAEQPNSVEISVNAKLQYSGKVKCYAPTISEAMTLAVKKAEELQCVEQ